MASVHGHSAKVDLNLLVDKRQLPLCQVGPKEVYLSEACEPIPATNGVIVITIDGVDHPMDVFFPNGIGTDGERVVYF
jgi:hypothetical protein